LKTTVDSELFSSTVAHITLLINFIVQSSDVEVRDYLDKTLKDRIPVNQWKTLRIVGHFHSIWAKTLKQIAIDNRSQTPCKPALNAPSVLDNQVPDTRHKSARVPDGDDGGDGDDGDDDDDESDDEKDKGRGGHRSLPSSDEDTDADPPEDCDRESDYSSEGDSQVGDRDSDDGNDTDFEDNSDCEIEPAKKKAKPKGEAALIQ
jgi:hypothetical protein